MASAPTALVFSVLCWLVFSVLHGDRDADSLPDLSRRFLAVQPWWLAVAALGLGVSFIAKLRDDEEFWRRVASVSSLLVSALGMVNIGWGIIAIFLLTLPPSGI